MPLLYHDGNASVPILSLYHVNFNSCQYFVGSPWSPRSLSQDHHLHAFLSSCRSRPLLIIMSSISVSRCLCTSSRGNPPSTTLYERQRVTPGQSTTSFQGAYHEQPTQPASTAAFYHRASQDDIPESPPVPIHSANQHSILHHMTPQQINSRSQTDPPLRSDRPIDDGPYLTLERVRYNTTSCDLDHKTWDLRRDSIVQCESPQSIQTPKTFPEVEFQRTDTPKHLFSLGDPRDRELRLAQAALLPPSPYGSRHDVPRTDILRSTHPSMAGLTTQLPTTQAVKARIPDKSLPVQEDEDEDDAYKLIDNQERERDRWAPDRGGNGRSAHRHDQEHHAASPLTSSSIPVGPYYHGFPHSPCSRQGAPIPPSPFSHAPAPHADSPYQFPFGHICSWGYAGSDNGTMDLSQLDPDVMRVYAFNNGGMLTDSTHSPSSTPLRGAQYNPSTFLQPSDAFGGRRGEIANSSASVLSSPSHEPVPSPPYSRRYRGRRRPERSQDLRRQPTTSPPSRIESTSPRDTVPEFSSGEETVTEFQMSDELQSGAQLSAPRSVRWDDSVDGEDRADDADGGKWIDEDVGIEGKRHQRWKLRWEALLREFHALDRETNTTSCKLHSVASRTVRRDSSPKSTDMKNIRSAFAEMASHQHASRPTSLIEQLSQACMSSRDDPPLTSNGARKEDLRRALDTTIGSFHALKTLYDQRETRWIEEKHRLDEEKEMVLLLLKKVLDVSVFGNLADRAR
ncbi:hypothetical protein EI94DRAFT_1733503 [Lactarius quietus]|nr:hypothetical protein EI94DRAFT_1733503 [Lactarius quietus]